METRERIHELEVAHPCDVPWDAMYGDDRSRFCEICERRVYNFAAMDELEILDCLRRSGDRVCAQIRRSDEGKIVTKPSAPSLRWFQFSLFSLLALMTTVATLLGFASYGRVAENSNIEEWEAIEEGGVVEIPDDFFVDK